MGGELSKECIAYTMVICGEIKNVGFRRFIWSLVKRLYDELSEYYYIVKDDRWEEHKF